MYAADNHCSYLTAKHILPGVIGRCKRVHNALDVQFIGKRLVNVETLEQCCCLHM